MKSIDEIRYEFLRGMNMLYEGWEASHVIEEAKTIDSLRDVKAFNGIPDDVINWILGLDSTYKGNEYVGKYTIALLDKYINGELEGLSDDEIKSAIKWFNGNRSSLPGDKRNFKNVDIRDITEIANSQSNPKESDPNGMHHGGINWPSPEEMWMREKSARILEVPSPNPNYRVFYPLTWEASNKIAGSPKSRWCTANSDKNWFNDYFNKSGGTYIFIDMNGTPLYNYAPGHGNELANPQNNHISINSQIGDELNLSSMDSTIQQVNEYVKKYKFAMKNQLQKRIDAGVSLEIIFDSVGDAGKGFKVVEFDGKFSYLNPDGKLIGDGRLWFRDVYDFHEGFAKVRRDDGKFSFIDARTGGLIKNGQLWFRGVYCFQEGFAHVRRDDYMCSFIDAKTGDLIKGGQLWFEEVYDFQDGYARVQGDDGMSFIDAKTGDLIKGGQLWFEEVYDFQGGYALVQRDYDGKWSFIDARTGDLIKNGQLWFNSSSSFYHGFAWVKRDDRKYSFIDARTGDLIKNGQLWFRGVDHFSEGFAHVQRDDGKWSFIDARTGDLIKNGQLWFNSSSSFNEGFALVQRDDGKWYKLDKEGNMHEING